MVCKRCGCGKRFFKNTGFYCKSCGCDMKPDVGRITTRHRILCLLSPFPVIIVLILAMSFKQELYNVIPYTKLTVGNSPYEQSIERNLSEILGKMGQYFAAVIIFQALILADVISFLIIGYPFKRRELKIRELMLLSGYENYKRNGVKDVTALFVILVFVFMPIIVLAQFSPDMNILNIADICRNFVELVTNPLVIIFVAPLLFIKPIIQYFDDYSDITKLELHTADGGKTFDIVRKGEEQG